MLQHNIFDSILLKNIAIPYLFVITYSEDFREIYFLLSLNFIYAPEFFDEILD